MNIISFTKVGFTAGLLYCIALDFTGVPNKQRKTGATMWRGLLYYESLGSHKFTDSSNYKHMTINSTVFSTAADSVCMVCGGAAKHLMLLQRNGGGKCCTAI